MAMRGETVTVMVLLWSAAAWAQAPAGDPAAGEKTFNQCKVCHTNEAGKNKVGPSLFGVVGRPSGTAPGFAYSPAMKGAGVTWTPENIDKYLSDPKAMVPGNKMAFPGLKNEQDRRNVIAYLSTLK